MPGRDWTTSYISTLVFGLFKFKKEFFLKKFKCSVFIRCWKFSYTRVTYVTYSVHIHLPLLPLSPPRSTLTPPNFVSFFFLNIFRLSWVWFVLSKYSWILSTGAWPIYKTQYLKEHRLFIPRNHLLSVAPQLGVEAWVPLPSLLEWWLVWWCWSSHSSHELVSAVALSWSEDTVLLQASCGSKTLSTPSMMVAEPCGEGVI